MNIVGSTIIIPSQYDAVNSDTLIIDFGKLNVHSKLQPKQQIQSLTSKIQSIQSSSSSNVEVTPADLSELFPNQSDIYNSYCYDHFFINLHAITIFMSSQGPNWKSDPNIVRYDALSNIEICRFLCSSISFSFTLLDLFSLIYYPHWITI